jgi:hypothetical protein
MQLDQMLDLWFAIIACVELVKIASHTQSYKRHIDLDINNEFCCHPTERIGNTRRRDSSITSSNDSSNNTNLSNIDSERPQRRQRVESSDSDCAIKDAVLSLTNTMSESITAKYQGKYKLSSAVKSVEHQLDSPVTNMENNQYRSTGLEADFQHTNNLHEYTTSRLSDNTKWQQLNILLMKVV